MSIAIKKNKNLKDSTSVMARVWCIKSIAINGQWEVGYLI